MQVRAKFRVNSLKQSMFNSESKVGTTVELVPVTSGSDENKEFFTYTPGGKIELSIVSEETAGNFKIGKEYYVDFTPAD